MHLLYRVIYATACRSTHHKLALDALRELEGPEAESWQRFFLRYYEEYLAGAKAPDDKFKDFTNHVLHVGDGFWGGAVKTAQDWYGRTVQALDHGQWAEAAYNAGVLSHYFTDPIQPFHTGQSTAENNIHRAAEWSICKSYDELRLLFEASHHGRLVTVPRGDDWLAQMIRAGAVRAHAHYQTLISHYDLDLGVADPPLGLDRTSREILADLIGYAAEGFARLLERAIADANVLPPVCWLAVQTVLATAKVPARYVLKQLQDADERRLVEAMYDELLDTGRVEQMLPEDDRVVRDAHAREVLGRGTAGVARATQAEPVPVTAVAAVGRTPALPQATPGATRATIARQQLTAPAGDWPGMTRARPVPARKTAEKPAGGDTPRANPAAANPRAAALPTIALSNIQSPTADEPDEPPAAARPRRSPVASERDVAGRETPVQNFKESAAPLRAMALPAEDALTDEATFGVADASPAETRGKHSGPDPSSADPAPARIEAAAAPPPEAPGASSAEKFYLEPARAVVDAPSIGPKMARRLSHFGIETVADLLAVNPQELAQKLNLRYVTAEIVRDWQDQSLLVCRIPNLRGHDAQILVACGYRHAEEVAEASVGRLFDAARQFAASAEGQRLLRGGAAPDRAEIEDWKSWARQSRPVRAA